VFEFLNTAAKILDRYVLRGFVERQRAKRELRARAMQCLRRLRAIQQAAASGSEDVVNNEKYHLGSDLDAYARVIDAHPKLSGAHAQIEREVREKILIGGDLSAVSPALVELEKLTA
jgi:hypothetical protein